jgi:TonB-dependent receptor
MRKKSFSVFFVILMFFILSAKSFCQNTCSIGGKITDKTNLEPLYGANIMMEGTGMGAASKDNGEYLIMNVPAGNYTLKVSYLGYRTEKLEVKLVKGQHLEQNFGLKPVGVTGKTVIVTAQASGQNAAINQQLSSQNIVNVVSAARIKELPDANAAESVGRLPGVYLIRTGGEGSEVAIRGLAPKYNEVMIDGVRMAATDPETRSVDLSMISSNILSGIEVYKTVTPDMDASVFGGVVNFQLREAKKPESNLPEIDLSAQGGYNNLQSSYNNYKFSGSIGERFFDNRLGILLQGVVENKNLTEDNLSVGYGLLTQKYGVPNPMQLNNLTLIYLPRIRRRYDATIVIDFKLPHGEIDLMNFGSQGYTQTETRSQSYGLGGSGSISFGAGYSTNTLNTITNLFHFSQDLPSLFNFDIRVSHSYSENISPDDWSLTFPQELVNLSQISQKISPINIAQSVTPLVNPDTMVLGSMQNRSSFSKQRNITASIDLEKKINISTNIAGTIKLGGMYKYLYRWFTELAGQGNFLQAQLAPVRSAVIKAFPWMSQPPYNLNPDGKALIPFSVFEDHTYDYGKFLGGNYNMGVGTNFNILNQLVDVVEQYGEASGRVNGTYKPNSQTAVADPYHGNEYENAGYLMTTINIGPQLIVIPGVRYQGLKTSYYAARIWAASVPNTYPLTFPHTDTTINEYHGYWLPDIIVKYEPYSWLKIQAAYTNTINYPDFSEIIPSIILNDENQSVIWENYALKPARSQNYDLALSVYNNKIGLLTADPFLKQIDDLIFSQDSYITDPSKYPGLPSSTLGYSLATAVNNPNRVNEWGVEFNWQTHFWYLPEPLNGLVLNVNYTHIFSGAKYPYVVSFPGSYPAYIPVHVDTFYTDRLIDQPNNIVNLSIGYDLKGFSAVVSMIYQADVFTETNFWPELRQHKDKYLRWDLSLKQDLPWFDISTFFDINNINGASDISLVQGNGFPASEADYGFTADLGLRWSLK